MQFTAIEQHISDVTGHAFRVEASHDLGGGCINRALRIEGGGRRYFLKLNNPDQLSMFTAEAAGLAAMAGPGAIRVPEPIAWGADEQHSWLALEFVPFGQSNAQTSTLLGEQLAAMHRQLGPEFGWERDNTIGATPQHNEPDGSWVRFYAEKRLGFQLRLARDNGAPARLFDRGQRLRASLHAFFDNYDPVPSLLHGDLWGGNWAADENGQPVLFDPAVYYGDREADLAMTELFGGFDDRFYQSYRHGWDIDPGYASRKVLYNLYHVLNHFNLFGGGYAGQAEGMVDSLLAEV